MDSVAMDGFVGGESYNASLNHGQEQLLTPRTSTSSPVPTMYIHTTPKPTTCSVPKATETATATGIIDADIHSVNTSSELNSNINNSSLLRKRSVPFVSSNGVNGGMPSYPFRSGAWGSSNYNSYGVSGPRVMLPSCLSPLTPEDKFQQNSYRKLGLRVILSLALAVLVMYVVTNGFGSDGSSRRNNDRRHGHIDSTVGDGDGDGDGGDEHSNTEPPDTWKDQQFIFGTSAPLLLSPPEGKASITGRGQHRTTSATTDVTNYHDKHYSSKTKYQKYHQHQPYSWLRPFHSASDYYFDEQQQQQQQQDQQKREDEQEIPYSSGSSDKQTDERSKKIQQSIYRQYQLHQHASRRALHHHNPLYETDTAAADLEGGNAGVHIHASAGSKLGVELDQLCGLLHHSARYNSDLTVDNSSNRANNIVTPPSPVASPPAAEGTSFEATVVNAQIRQLSSIHMIQHVLAAHECWWIIEEAEKGVIDEWHNSGDLIIHDIRDKRMEQLYLSVHTQHRAVAAIPVVQFFLHNIVYQVLVPLITEYYNLPLGRLGINSLHIVKVNSGGATAFQEFLSTGQFSFLIPLNNNYLGGQYVLTTNNNDDMEQIYMTPLEAEKEKEEEDEVIEEEGRHSTGATAGGSDGGYLYESFLDTLLTAEKIKETERNIEAILDRRQNHHHHHHQQQHMHNGGSGGTFVSNGSGGSSSSTGSNSKYTHSNTDNTDTQTLVLTTPPPIGSAILFSAKTMVHKQRVTSGHRYVLVGSLGYVESNACGWYNNEMEEDSGSDYVNNGDGGHDIDDVRVEHRHDNIEELEEEESELDHHHQQHDRHQQQYHTEEVEIQHQHHNYNKEGLQQWEDWNQGKLQEHQHREHEEEEDGEEDEQEDHHNRREF